MSTICAWCGTAIQPALRRAVAAIQGPSQAPAQSHGMCRSCIERQLKR